MTTEEQEHEDTLSSDESPSARRALALELLLEEKGIVQRADIERVVADLDKRSVYDGGRVVARAWVDQGFKKRLFSDAKRAVSELGYADSDEIPTLIVVENTPTIHYLVVCTLCSCYPRWLLGRPPDWYKSLPYRSRAVAEPRVVLQEFGLNLSPKVEVRVVDSTAEIRYMVLPRRPSNTEGLSERELACLVTRDSLIGVAEPLAFV